MNDLDFDIDASRARLLSPVDRISEVLFGLFMALTFTGTLSVMTAGREEVRSMVWAAIGCNIAWGFVDAVMYVLRNLVERGRKARIVKAVRGAERPEHAHRLIGNEIGALAQGIETAGIERLRQWIVTRRDQDLPAVHPTARDLRAALGVFLLVFLSTFPVVLPFVFIGDVVTAKRVSALVAIGMLFLCGYAWGRFAGVKPLRTGMVMVLLGMVIEAIVIALGG